MSFSPLENSDISVERDENGNFEVYSCLNGEEVDVFKAKTSDAIAAILHGYSGADNLQPVVLSTFVKISMSNGRNLIVQFDNCDPDSCLIKPDLSDSNLSEYYQLARTEAIKHFAYPYNLERLAESKLQI